MADPFARCLKCGLPLPQTGDCPSCAAREKPKGAPPDRRTAAAAPVPSFDQLTARPPPRAAPPPPPATGYKPAAPVIPVGQRETQPGMPAMQPAAPKPAVPPPAAAAPVAAPPRPSPLTPVVPPPAVAPPRPPPPTQPAAPARKNTEEELVASHLSPKSTTAKLGELHAEPAALWRRLLAFVIDTAIVFGVSFLFLMVAAAIAGVKSPETPYGGIDRLITYARAFETVLKPTLLLGLMLALAYSTVFAVIWGGRTVGRMIARIHLVDRSGYPPTPARAATRSFLAIFSFALFLGGFWLALFDRYGQTLHDKLTGTFVIRR